MGPGSRTVSYYLLACACVLIFVQDLLVTFESVGGAAANFGEALAPAIFVFFGAAALHPDRHKITERPSEFDVVLTWRRAILLGVALVMAPVITVIDITTTKGFDLRFTMTSSIIMSLLVLARLINLVRTQERATSREQVLREANAAFAVAPDRSTP